MSDALQVALILATLALTVLLVVLTRLVLQATSKIDVLVRSAEDVKTRLDAVLVDSHELLQNVNVISTRVQAELDEVDSVLHTARLWTDRADHLVDEVGAFVEPPMQAMARTGNVLKVGVGTFFRTLFEANANGQSRYNNP